MKKVMAILLLFQSHISYADQTHCFHFVPDDTPDRHAIGPDFGNSESWCYSTGKTEEGESVLVYNADYDEIQPELVALITKSNESGKASVAHTSNVKGELSWHQTEAGSIELFAVPLNLDEAKRRGTTISNPERIDRDDVTSWVQELGTVRAPFVTNTIREGIFTASVAEESKPFGGYWWSYGSLNLSSGPYSPLGKYDRMIEDRTGSSSQAVTWENANHSLTNVSWGGHCNGWAASSVLHHEIDSPKWDPVSKVVLTNSDFNGMLAEASFCVHWAFYGRRNYGRSTDDASDIYPDKFHKVLTYYIDHLAKPVAMDYYRDSSVDNHVISGYTFDIQKDPDAPLTYIVTAELNVHGYDSSINNATGIAHEYNRTYQYKLFTDDSNTIIGGEWISSNPDFLWVPLMQKKCGRENPHLDHDTILDWMENLEDAQSMITPIQRTFQLEAEETLAVIQNLKGSLFTVTTAGNIPEGLMLEATGYPLKPSRGNESTVTQQFPLRTSVHIPFQELVDLKIVNQSETAMSEALQILDIEYIGGN